MFSSLVHHLFLVSELITCLTNRLGKVLLIKKIDTLNYEQRIG
jgi:hypothetical protein